MSKVILHLILYIVYTGDSRSPFPSILIAGKVNLHIIIERNFAVQFGQGHFHYNFHHHPHHKQMFEQAVCSVIMGGQLVKRKIIITITIIQMFVG